MKSTGEVMGIDSDFGWAFVKAQAGAGAILPTAGTAFISVKSEDRAGAYDIASRLAALGFRITATSGTAVHLSEQGLCVDIVNKVQEGRPHIVDHIKNGDVALVVNIVATASAQTDSLSIRREALQKGVPYYTTMRGALAAVMGIEALVKKGLAIRALQEYHRES
jgi:carbamoyl-phosphate synthase large subunit